MKKKFCIVYRTKNGIYHSKGYETEHSWEAVDALCEEVGDDNISKVLGKHQVTGNIWNDGEEPLDLTEEELEYLVQLDIKHDKGEEDMNAYYARTHWMFLVLEKIISYPLLLLKWIGFALSSPFLLFVGICESVSDWYENVIRNFEMWVGKEKIDVIQKLRKEHKDSHFKMLYEKHEKNGRKTLNNMLS